MKRISNLLEESCLSRSYEFNQKTNTKPWDPEFRIRFRFQVHFNYRSKMRKNERETVAVHMECGDRTRRRRFCRSSSTIMAPRCPFCGFSPSEGPIFLPTEMLEALRNGVVSASRQCGSEVVVQILELKIKIQAYLYVFHCTGLPDILPRHHLMSFIPVMWEKVVDYNHTKFLCCFLF